MILTDNSIPKYLIARDILQEREWYVEDNAIFSVRRYSRRWTDDREDFAETPLTYAPKFPHNVAICLSWPKLTVPAIVSLGSYLLCSRRQIQSRYFFSQQSYFQQFYLSKDFLNFIFYYFLIFYYFITLILRYSIMKMYLNKRLRFFYKIWHKNKKN